jgi:8-oxo-dGTP pyrophosphatase MutT (NUDIX family)
VSSALDYPVLGSESIYRGRILGMRVDKVRMSDGVVVDREVVEHIGAVGVVALDDDGRVLLINQYRHPVQTRLDELPAGLLDVDGEPAIEAAKRELAEEAGVTAATWKVLVDLYPSPGFSTEAIRIFLARGIRHIPEDDRHQREHEELTLTVEMVPFDEAMRRVFAGEITNAAAVAGVLAAARAAENGFADLRPPDAPWAARPGH